MKFVFAAMAVLAVATVAYVWGARTAPQTSLMFPPFQLALETPDRVSAKGTWQLEPTSITARPAETVLLTCSRSEAICDLVSVVVNQDRILPLSINRVKIKSWSETHILACWTDSPNTAFQTMIDLADKKVMGGRGPDDGQGCPTTIEQSMRLVNGYDGDVISYLKWRR